MTYWSVSSQVLIEEAEKLGLKTELLIPEKNFFLVKGNGKEILFKSTDFWQNSSLGFKISNDKELCYSFLERHHFPIAKTRYIDEQDFPKYDWTVFGDFHFPLVIKPIDGAHGDGVKMNITSISELQKKLWESFEIYPSMIVQEQISWDECRVLVVLGEVILAIQRNPPVIEWNGESTIHQLISYENKNNSLRGEGYNSPLAFIEENEELIHFVAKQWHELNQILPSWVQLQLRWNSNLGTGGTLEDITDTIHPSIKEVCVGIAKELGLGICWVDILSSDFTKPLSETGWVILEVNATPGLGGDRELTSVNTGRRILQKLFTL